MPRPQRTCLPNLTYHVYSRCIEWRDMMKEDRFKELFIDILVRTQNKYDFELNGYQILDNHFHLVIRTVEGGATISRIMQCIKARFAEQFNKETKRIGPFWNERFKDKIAEEQEEPDPYILWLLWYIAFNCVRKGIVSDPRDYKFGSIKCYIYKNFNSRMKITLHRAFLELGDTFEERVRKFLWFEDAYRRRLAVIF